MGYSSKGKGERMDKRLKKLTILLCEWNREEITDKELANRVWDLYEKEALETWNDPLEYYACRVG